MVRKGLKTVRWTGSTRGGASQGRGKRRFAAGGGQVARAFSPPPPDFDIAIATSLPPILPQLLLLFNDRRTEMSDHSRVYIGTAFVAGALLTLGIKDLLYPKLEHRFRNSRRESNSTITLRDLTKEDNVPESRKGPPAIVDGIEGCIGNTPLFRIKSLSEATGCEILGKAEVFFSRSSYSYSCF